MTTLFTAAALLATLAVAPAANAATAGSPMIVGAVAAAPAASELPAAAKPASPTRYCVQRPQTGSMFNQQVCKTRAKWLAEGTDPLAAK